MGRFLFLFLYFREVRRSQVDLWTQEAQGCACPWNATLRTCACCVRDGGCHCGKASPHRCAQCGLERHCNNMCNVTLDARFLSAHSGKAFGQLKSPSLEGPGQCWYLLQPDHGQRVEIQLYRLVSVGKFNGTACEGGFVQLVDGMEPKSRLADSMICGGNERFAPPVVLFADRGPATLIFQITEPTIRSQFLAYFSFTAAGSKHGAGVYARGGTRLDHTECDWLYQDVGCRGPRGCALTSPGHPGLYPPNRTCKYRVATSSPDTLVRLNFTQMLLPHNHCPTHYVSVYEGSSPGGPVLATLCANKKTFLEHTGPNLLIEFNSGPPVPPYDYNGFVATLEFVERRQTAAVSTEAAPPAAARTSSLAPLVMSQSLEGGGGGSGSGRATARPGGGCRLDADGGVSNSSRSGQVDSRGLTWSAICTWSFRGRSNDIVHLSLFNFALNSPSCQSSIEIYDGDISGKPTKRFCSPTTKHARDPAGKFLSSETFVSTGSLLTLVFKRSHPLGNLASGSVVEPSEFLDGAYLFHDEHISGTVQPTELCHVDFYGLGSPTEGQVIEPGAAPVFWNIDGPLRCRQRFVPAANQSVTMTVRRLAGLAADPHCHTQCGDAGCRCVANMLPLSQMDHLLIVATETGQELACLCGHFQEEWLPVSVRSWSTLELIYSVAHYSWPAKGFVYQATYAFRTDALCGRHVFTKSEGEVQSRVLPLSSTSMNHYFHQECSWLLDFRLERRLTIELSTNQNRPCSAWNVSVHRYDESRQGGSGEMLHTFCPRDRIKLFNLPAKMDTVLLRLHAMTVTLPEFAVRWNTQQVRANTRVADEAAASAPAAAAAAASAPAVTLPTGLSPIILLLPLKHVIAT